MFGVRLCVLAALGLSATLLAAGQQPVYRGSARTVSIYATVVDPSGHLVTDLTRDDFDVFDNGRRQPLTVFVNDLQPITIVVMLDRSGSMVRNALLVQRAAEQFVVHLLPDDKARVGSFSTRIQIDPETFTSDQAELLRILGTNLQESGPTPLWSATDAAMAALAGQDGRRVVLVFTDGKDTPGWLGTTAASFDQVRERSRAEEIMVYGIGLSDRCRDDPATGEPRPATAIRWQRPGRRGPVGGGRLPPGRIPLPLPLPPMPGGPPTIPGREFPPRTPPFSAPRPAEHGCVDEAPDPELRALAEDGGGGYFELRSTENLGTTFARVADELHHQYALAFTPWALDGTVHQLTVRVRRPDLTARARKTYFAPRETAAP